MICISEETRKTHSSAKVRSARLVEEPERAQKKFTVDCWSVRGAFVLCVRVVCMHHVTARLGAPMTRQAVSVSHHVYMVAGSIVPQLRNSASAAVSISRHHRTTCSRHPVRPS